MNVTSLKTVLDEMLGSINYEKDSKPGKLFPFMVRVGCVKRRPPRHEFFQYLLEIGTLDIDRVLNHLSLNGSKELVFFFPERYMNVYEQQHFMYAMMRHPEAKTIKQVDIITSAPLIVGNFFKEQVRILTWPDDKEYERSYY